jgi:hypothetical protein
MKLEKKAIEDAAKEGVGHLSHNVGNRLTPSNLRGINHSNAIPSRYFNSWNLKPDAQ